MERRWTSSVSLWFALAIAGLAVAVVVSYAASQLTKPRVGLTSERVSAVANLAPSSKHAGVARPAPVRAKRARRAGHLNSAPPPAMAAPVTPAPAPASPRPSGDDSGGDDSHSGGSAAGHPDD